MKTLWEKKKLLITSNFFFSHNVFYSIRKLYCHLSIFLTSYLYLVLNWKSLKLALRCKALSKYSKLHFTSSLSHIHSISFTGRVPRGPVVKCLTCNPGFEPHWILWVFSWECPWARHFRAQPNTGETQERHE